MNNLVIEPNTPAQDVAINELIAMLSAKMLREDPSPAHMNRDAHPKMIGLLRAEFIIEKDLPDDLKIGLFAVPKTYPTWIRFSNQLAPPGGDDVKDIRGMALKLTGVDGKKVLEGAEDFKTHDFITISTDAFVSKDVVQFAGLIKALVGGGLKMALYMLCNPWSLWNLLSANKRYGSLLEARFFSVSPYCFGDSTVKYSIKPQSDQQTPLADKLTQNYLTTIMAAQLDEKDYYFDFMIQFRKDPEKMPVEDLRRAWKESDSPFIKVATIKIPIQKFNTPEQNAYGDVLSFNPWHCLPPHTPLGSVNRARKVIYQTLSKYRHGENKLPLIEPTNLEIPLNLNQ